MVAFADFTGRLVELILIDSGVDAQALFSSAGGRQTGQLISAGQPKATKRRLYSGA